MRRPHWTSLYFGPLYGEIYSRHLLPASRSQAEARFIRGLLGPQPGPVLDLASGFGRHARILQRWYPVVALDLNAHYLKMGMEGRGGRVNRVYPIAGDMRTLPLADSCVSAVLLLFNSFGYFPGVSDDGATPARSQIYKLPKVFYDRKLVPAGFGMPVEALDSGVGPSRADKEEDENMRVIAEVGRVLSPDGSLVVEFPNPRAVKAAIEEQPRQHISVGGYTVDEEFQYLAEARVLTNRTRFSDGTRTETVTYRIRLYDRQEAEAVLESSALVPKAAYGGYSSERFHASRHDTLILHAVRARTTVEKQKGRSRR